MRSGLWKILLLGKLIAFDNSEGLAETVWREFGTA